jgi:hypothetical protein
MFAMMCWANLLFAKQVGACQETGLCVFGHLPTSIVIGYHHVPTPGVRGQGIKDLTPQCRHNNVCPVCGGDEL